MINLAYSTKYAVVQFHHHADYRSCILAAQPNRVIPIGSKVVSLGSICQPALLCYLDPVSRVQMQLIEVILSRRQFGIIPGPPVHGNQLSSEDNHLEFLGNNTRWDLPQ